MVHFKNIFLLVALSAITFAAGAQTNTVTTGTWNDPTVWSTGAVPAANATVNVNHALELNVALNITGTYNINQNLTDFPGGIESTLTLGGTLNVTAGTTNFLGVTGSIGGGGAFIYVRNGATLILTGPTAFANGTVVLVEAGGTLIINGNFDNNITGSGSFTVEGLVQINGDYSSNGNVDLLGAGDLITTGNITTTGASGTVFGSTNNCTTPPCSGQNLCLGGGVNIIGANQYLCSGSTASALTGDAIASATYQWTSSITSSTSGFSDIVGATGKDLSPITTPTQTTWYRRRVVVGSCTGTSSAVVITIIPGSSWRGITSVSWHTTTNWCGGAVPTATTDVIVPAGVQFQPSVTSANGVARNITINAGATLTVENSRTLSIAGNLVNNGTLTTTTVTTTGNVQYNGTAAQTISGSGFNTYATLIINNTSGAVPAVDFTNSAVSVSNQLTLTAGAVDLSTFNVTVGNASTNIGALTYTAGRFYNGNVTRWLGTGAVAVGAVAGLFPIGSSADYRPISFSHAGLTVAGTIRVNHSAVANATAVSFNDNAIPVLARSNSFWGVATGNSLGTGTFAVQTEGTGFGTVADVTHLRMTLVNSAASGTPGTNGGSLTNPQVNRTGLSTANLTNNFYWGSTNSVQTTLPITLLNFAASSTMEGVKLLWRTSTEENFSHFEIERSRDGAEFETISATAARGGSNLLTNYSFVDGTAKAGRYYFRLKSVDIDGVYEYSKVERVDVNNSSFQIASIFPNPVAGKFTVSVFEGRSGKLTVIDKYGRNVAEGELHDGNQDFELQNLPTGIYYARIQTESGAQTIKILLTK